MNLVLAMIQGQMDWPSTAGMLTVIVMGSGVIGGLIGALICKPMIETAMTRLVSREIFDIYAANDKNEHSQMRDQLAAIWETLEQRHNARRKGDPQ